MTYLRGLQGHSDAVYLESAANKTGYRHADVAGNYAPNLSATVDNVVPEELKSPFNVQAIAARLQPVYKHLKPSSDAGRFLCEFIFYTSLAQEHQLQTGRKVQFVHVPSLPATANMRADGTVETNGGSSESKSSSRQGGPYILDELVEILKSVVVELAREDMPTPDPNQAVRMAAS